MAVYTEVTDEALAAFLADYDIGSMVAFRGIAEGVENSNYSLRTTSGDFILTLYERRVDPAELPWFLGLMEHLAQARHRLPAAGARPRRRALRHLCGRHAAITTFLPGVWPRRVRPEHCGPVGAALAALHVAGRDYAPTRRNALGPDGWRPLLERSRARADEVQAGPGERTGRGAGGDPGGMAARAAGRAHPRRPVPGQRVLPGRQAVGADRLLLRRDRHPGLRRGGVPERVVLRGGLLVQRHQGAGAAVAPMPRRAPLSDAERAALPVLCRGAAIRFLLTRLYDWLNTPPGALVTRKDPLEYLRRLRFHLAARDEHAYGI